MSGINSFQYTIGIIYMAAHTNGPHRHSKRFSESHKKVLKALTWKFTILFLDDCIIFSSAIEKNLKCLREVFPKFKEANIKINPAKCVFFRQTVPFLVHVVGREGYQMDLEKTSTVNRHGFLKDATEVETFLGLSS